MKLYKIKLCLTFMFLFLLFKDSSQLELKSAFRILNAKAGTKKEDNKPEEKIEGKSPDNENVIQQLWIHFIKYAENFKAPSEFFKNDAYFRQQKYENLPEYQGKEKIPSETHFFGILEKEFFNIFEDKNQLKSSVYDSLPIEKISPVPQDRPEQGPIRGIDKYKEGYCFKVATKSTIREIWLICTEDESEAKSLMENFIKTKIEYQQARGDIVTVSGEAPEDADIGPKEGSTDGYWKILKDWGECTKICGGGKQYRQLMCIKPTLESKDCEGNAIRERDCNTQPCPKPEEFMAEKANQNLIDFEKSDVKFVPISNKPLRYDKCIIKESDALVVKDEPLQEIPILGNKERKDPNKMPIRLVMNSKSIAAFKDDKYETPYKTLDLYTTDFLYKQEGDSISKFCFIIKDASGTRMEICQLDCSQHAKSFVEEWREEINTFKVTCRSHTERNTVEADLEFEAEVKALKNELEKKQKEQIRQEEINKEIQNLQKVKTEQQVNVYGFLQKEKKLEELLEKEEEEKGLEEIKELEVQMENEKKKTGCLIDFLKEKKMANQITIAKAQAEKEVEKMKLMAQEQLAEMREASKKRILAKQKVNSRKIREISNKIENIRMEAAEKIRAASFLGDENKCFLGTKERESDIEFYCGVAYLDDPFRYNECRDYSKFCLSCCEHEFPEVMQRESCVANKCAEPESV